MTEEEFLGIYREHMPVIFRFCSFRTGSREDAEDLTAEVFARLLARGAEVSPGKRVAWLHTVARNLCIDLSRRKRPDRLEEADMAEAAGPERLWLDDAVRRAVTSLPPEQQQVLFLRAIEDLPFARIASLLGIAEAAARKRFERAVTRLRPLLPEVQ